MERALVTGGAGFIASHIVDSVLSKMEVVVLDDLSSGSVDNLERASEHPNFSLVNGSIVSEQDVDSAISGCCIVYHFAAQPDVQVSLKQPYLDFKTNVDGSLVVLESMRKHDVTQIVFASSGGTVYGESPIMPTPESTPFRPISNYGAAKAAVEMYLSSYCHLYGFSVTSMRMANVVGPRSRHGVLFDFYNKLKRNPSRLEVLGTGAQTKAYIAVEDVVRAAMVLANAGLSGFTPVNVASGELLRVSRIAEIVVEELGVPSAQIEYTGSERGWAGDVIQTDLDISLLRSLGWNPEVAVEDAVRSNLRWFVDRFGGVS
ncbi:MAG: NAD-dependent epimerase/dehydratase family protein [Candidatus Thorarchaeota archaeon]|nr:MAG: UDP-glucose 4-epimerase [Candidatus Thorarchaeota archaeon]